MDPTDPVPLSSAPADINLSIRQIDGGRGMRSRLASMGIVPGACMRLLKTRAAGPYIIGLKEARVVVGHGMARRILVMPHPDPENAACPDA